MRRIARHVLALSCAIAVWTGSDSSGSAAEPDLAEQLAAWKTLSVDEKHEAFYGWADAMIDELTVAAERSESYSEIIYGIQIRTNVLLTYAFDRKDQRLLRRLGELYLLPLEHLQEADPAATAQGAAPAKIATWVDPSGRVRALTASQFLYLIAYTIRRSLDLSDEERPAALDKLTTGYAPVFREHLRRWVFGEPGVFSVRGWGCDAPRYHHAEFVRLKHAHALHGDRVSAPAYCNALWSTDLWIIAIAAEVLAAQDGDTTLNLIDEADIADFEAYRDVGAKLIASRLDPTEVQALSGSTGLALGFDSTAWHGHPDHRYSGYRGTIFPEENSAVRFKDPSFEDLAEAAWTVVGEGATRQVADPVLAGRTALRIDLAAGNEVRIAQAVPLHARGRITAHLHHAKTSTARVEAKLIVAGHDEMALRLEPAGVRLEGWEGLQTTIDVEDDARLARLDVTVSGPGFAVIDEARIVPTGAGAAEQPLVVVQPVWASGAWDISHARRLVQIAETLDALDLLPSDLSGAELKKGLARQIAYRVFNGTLDEPSFANYLDGTDGWYRVNYVNRVGFGYAPGQLSTSVINGGYCRWSRHDKRLREICTALWTLMQADPLISPAFATCHMSGFIARPCGRLAERALNLVASLDLLPPLPENRVH